MLGRTIRRALLTGAGALALVPPLGAQEAVTFPVADDGLISADLYGSGAHGVLLVPGARFDKESWQSEARVLADGGFLVLAISLRGRGESRAGTAGPDALHLDVLGAARYLRSRGAESIAAIGASIGGWAVARAVAEADADGIDPVVLLAHSPIERPEGLGGRTLFIVGRDDVRGGGVRRLPEIEHQFERARGPKELLVLEGSAHAQALFGTEQRERLLREILGFLEGPGSTAAQADRTALDTGAGERTFPDAPIVDRFDPDSAWAAELEAEGERYESERAVLFVPAGALTAEQGRALADTLDRVVAAVEEVIGGPHPWQRWHRPRVRYYFPAEPLISHVNAGARVYVSLPRLRTGTAPLAHETAHALLAPQRDTLADALTPETAPAFIERFPFWLQEGIADVVALEVSERTGLSDYDVFAGGPLSPPGPRCNRWLADERGRSVLPFIGTAGRPPTLMWDRENVAPPFYVCSHSFTRYLVDRHGVPAVAALLNEKDIPAALARLEARPVDDARAAWLATLEK